VYVNTNGNISFGSPASTYTPRAFPGTLGAMIAPYWADVDIRKYDGRCMGERPRMCHSPTHNGVWWHLEPGRMVVTWHRVGYYDCHNDKRMNFQLVLNAVDGSCDVGGSDFDVVFRYNTCEWTTGDASGGRDGFGGRPAVAGFDAGNDVDFVMIPGSRMDNIHRRVCNGSNVGMPGLWRFHIRRGAVVCPDAGGSCETGMPGVCGAGVTSCVADGTACIAVVGASAERCDGLDNDCNGEVDDGGGLCTGAQVCDRGGCVEPCFEFGCADGEVCTTTGTCIDAGCDATSCPEGQRCVGGACVSACDGVVCPAGRECRSGRCIDPCATLACGDCGACSGGACVDHCRFAGCPAGASCGGDGVCIDAACAGVSCGAGQVCRAGACTDACAGAVCPAGESCELGECIPLAGPVPVPPPPPTDPAPDAGSPPVGADADGGVATDPECKDATCLDGGGATGGCAVAPGQPPARATSAAWLVLVLALLGLVRRPRGR
jgi:hypothetical protein